MTRWLGRAGLTLGLLVLLVFAYITASHLGFVLLYFGVLLTAVSWGWARLGSRGLRLTREPPEGAYEVGETFGENLELHNHGFVGLPWIEVIDESSVPGYDAGRAVSLGAGRTRRWRSQGRFTVRGCYRMGPLRIVTGDPFGLFQRSSTIAAQSSVTVYPRLVDVSRVMPGAAFAAGDTIAIGRFLDAPPDAFGIREHNPRDGFNRIHWASTARLGRPMSKSFEKYEGSDTLIVLDLMQKVHRGSGAESTLEYAISLAASMAVTSLGRGQSVGLACNDGHRTLLASEPGLAQMHRILDFLALAQADGHISLDSLIRGLTAGRGQQSLVVITPSGRSDWIDRLAQAGSSGNRRSIVLHLDAESFVAVGPVPPSSAGPRPLGDHLVWWTIGLDDQLFRPPPEYRPYSGEHRADPLGVAS